MMARTLANLLTAARLALVPAMLLLALAGQSSLFLTCLGLALATDAVDGTLARRSGGASILGSKLDSWADLGVYTTVPLGIWWLWPDVIAREAVWAAAIVGGYLAAILVGLVKHRRITSYHTWGAKLAAVLIGAGTFVLLLGGPAWPFRISAVVLGAAALEEIAITLVLPEWRSNVPTLRHAWAWRQSSSKRA
jgi:CDP-diacylglycerol--glycerol-3-phosphate 3-phosphatidyltransferase